jgi:transposase-like protein
MKEYPLSFTILSNGRIGDVIADPREDYEILNLKRGILSALQTHGVNEEEFNRRRSVGERTVSFSEHVSDTTGRCLTDFTMTMESEEMLVVSKRNYQDCTYRPLLRKQPKKDKSQLTSSFKQEQKIDRVNLLISHSSFQEVHEFVPHNGQEHLAAITNTFTGQLTLIQAGKAARKREYLTDVQALGKRMSAGFRVTNLFIEDAGLQHFQRRKRGDLTVEEEALQQPILARVFDYADRIAEKYLRHEKWLHNGDPVEVPDIAEEFIANPFVMQSVLRLCLVGRPQNKCDFAAFTVLLDALGVAGRHDGSDALISWFAFPNRRYLNPGATTDEKEAVLDTLALMMHPSIEAVRKVFSLLPEPGQYQVPHA